MSLKAFHIVFVIVSTLFAFGFGAWSIHYYQTTEHTGVYLGMGIGSLAGGIALLIYGRYILRKLKNFNYL